MSACLQCESPRLYARGLCSACYGRSDKAIRRGEMTWPVLVALGQALTPLTPAERGLRRRKLRPSRLV